MGHLAWRSLCLFYQIGLHADCILITNIIKVPKAYLQLLSSSSSASSFLFEGSDRRLFEWSNTKSSSSVLLHGEIFWPFSLLDPFLFLWTSSSLLLSSIFFLLSSLSFSSLSRPCSSTTTALFSFDNWLRTLKSRSSRAFFFCNFSLFFPLFLHWLPAFLLCFYPLWSQTNVPSFSLLVVSLLPQGSFPSFSRLIFFLFFTAGEFSFLFPSGCFFAIVFMAFFIFNNTSLSSVARREKSGYFK